MMGPVTDVPLTPSRKTLPPTTYALRALRGSIRATHHKPYPGNGDAPRIYLSAEKIENIAFEEV